MTVLVLIILAVLYFFYCKYKEKVRKKHLEYERSVNGFYDKVYNLYLSQMSLFVEKVQRRFAYVNFDIGKYKDKLFFDKLYQNLFQKYGLSKPVDFYCRELLFIVSLKLAHICSSKNTFICPSKSSTISSKLKYSDSSFLENEEKNNFTQNGCDPLDWSIRRKIVWHRDNMRCQCCGLLVRLDKCHIHHIIRRADGGNHALSNLITLCKDCHTKMPGHEKMKAFTSYCLSKSKIHTPRCKYAKYATPVISTYSKLREKGLSPCQVCRPWERNEWKIMNYRYSYGDSVNEILHSIYNQKVEIVKSNTLYAKQPELLYTNTDLSTKVIDILDDHLDYIGLSKFYAEYYGFQVAVDTLDMMIDKWQNSKNQVSVIKNESIIKKMPEQNNKYRLALFYLLEEYIIDENESIKDKSVTNIIEKIFKNRKH